MSSYKKCPNCSHKNAVTAICCENCQQDLFCVESIDEEDEITNTKEDPNISHNSSQQPDSRKSNFDFDSVFNGNSSEEHQQPKEHGRIIKKKIKQEDSLNQLNSASSANNESSNNESSKINQDFTSGFPTSGDNDNNNNTKAHGSCQNEHNYSKLNENIDNLVISNSEKNLSLKITDAPQIIGRGVASDSGFPGYLSKFGAVSRKHLKIWKQNNSIYIEDNSTNGTYVNGKQIDKFKPVTVKKGDTITLAYGKDAAVLTIIATDDN